MIINQLWKRLNVLVPEPQCRTFGDEYDAIQWKDQRSKPTIVELQSISQGQIDAPEIERQNKLNELAIRLPPQTPVAREEFNNLLDILKL